MPIAKKSIKHVNKIILPKINKNLAIANRSRVSCINTNNNTMTLKSGLESLNITESGAIQFKSLGVVSYSHSIVTTSAVSALGCSRL